MNSQSLRLEVGKLPELEASLLLEVVVVVLVQLVEVECVSVVLRGDWEEQNAFLNRSMYSPQKS